MILYNSSALPRIVTCPGSVALTAAAPKPDDSDASAEGTAFHHFAALLLTGASPSVGDKAPNGHVLDAEMLEHAHAYADLLTTDPSWTQRVEAPMHWGPGGVANDSQPWQVRVKVDNVTWRPDIATLAVTDAKYGFRYVEVQDNWQLLSQAIGACFALQIQPKQIILAIYQPRGPGEPLRHVTLTPEELLAAYSFLCDHLTDVASTLQTSPHCRYCPAFAGCPAAERATYNAIDVALNVGSYKPEDGAVRTELDLIDRAEEFLKQRKKWLEEHAVNQLRNGKTMPGLYTKTQLGNTKWRENVTVTDLRLLGNNYLEEKPVTPTEAKRRGMSAADLEKLAYRPTTGVKLIRGDPTEAAAKAFGDGAKPKKTAKKKDTPA